MTCLVYLIAVAYVVALVISARYFAPREGYYSTAVVFGISAFIYYIAIPLETALFDEEIHAAGDFVFLSPAQQVQISLMGLLAFVAFLVGYRLSKFVPLEGEEPENGPEPAARHAGRIPKSLLIFGAGSAAVLILVFAPELRLTVLSYEGSYETAYQHSVFSLLCTYVVLALALVAAVLLCRNRERPVLALVIGTPLFFWGIFSSSKQPMFIALLGLATYFLGKRSRSPKLLLWIGGGAAMFILLSPIFSMYRGGLTLSEAWDDYYCGVSRTDARGPMFSLAREMSERDKLAFGGTYFTNVFLWIPKFIWPERPLDLSEVFARDNMIGWSPGQGLGYSLLAEAYVNFWWFGPLIQYLLIGLLWGKVWAMLRRILRPAGEAYWRAIYGVVGFYLLTMMHRGPTVATTKTMLQILVPIILLRYLFDYSSKTSLAPAVVGAGGQSAANEGGTL